jgi:hypothetical protein
MHLYIKHTILTQSNVFRYEDHNVIMSLSLAVKQYT